MNQAEPLKPVPEQSEYIFFPERLSGFLLLIPLALVLIVINVFLFLLFSRQQPGILFFLSFILSVGFMIPVAAILYRIYGLSTARYQITRSAIQLKWGIHSEIIPLSDVMWVRKPDEMNTEVPWPPLPMPGAYNGRVRTGDHSTIEFLASNVRRMVFIGTMDQIYGISPSDPDSFILSFERILQMGTLSNTKRETIRPIDWISASFGNRTARISMVLSIGLLILLSLWIGFRMAATSTVRLGFTPAGIPNDPIPVQNILILPILAAAFWLINLISGIQMYKEPVLRKYAELLWGFSPVILFCFLVAAFLVI